MTTVRSWRDMLEESLKDPNFRREWEKANAELAGLDRTIAARQARQKAQPRRRARLRAK